MSEYNFKGLTNHQQMILTRQGWSLRDADSGVCQPSSRSVNKLITRGLVIEHEEKWRGMIVKTYEVPIPVHMAWCSWCAEHGA